MLYAFLWFALFNCDQLREFFVPTANLKLSQQSLKLEVQPLFLSLGTHRKVVRNHSTASTRNLSTSWTITLVHKLLLGILLLLVMMTQERRHVKRTALKLVLVFVVNLCLKLCSANWRAVVSVLIILLLQHRHQPPQFYHTNVRWQDQLVQSIHQL